MVFQYTNHDKGPTVFGNSWQPQYSFRASQPVPKASRIPSPDPRVGACSLPVLDEHCSILENHLLHLFEDKIDSNQEFLAQAQRQSIVFIRWAITLQIA